MSVTKAFEKRNSAVKALQEHDKKVVAIKINIAAAIEQEEFAKAAKFKITRNKLESDRQKLVDAARIASENYDIAVVEEQQKRLVPIFALMAKLNVSPAQLLDTPEFKQVLASRNQIAQLEAQKPLPPNEVQKIREFTYEKMNLGWPVTRIIQHYPKYKPLISSIYRKKIFTIQNPETKETYRIGYTAGRPPVWVTYILNNSESPIDYQLK